MKIKRKEGVKRIKIEHNKTLFWIIILLIIAFIVLLFYINKINNVDESSLECTNDSDCIAASCCHPDSCVSFDKKPDCSKVICSAECSGPLDCGLGSCGCVKNKCQIVKK